MVGIVRLIFGIGLFGCVGFTQLQATDLLDPTRPPVELNSVPMTKDVAQQAVASDTLQSVILAPHYRAAIISGHTVRLGESYGEARLVEVSEGQVVLESVQGKRVLKLFPEVFIKKSDTKLVETAGASKPKAKAALDRRGEQ